MHGTIARRRDQVSIYNSKRGYRGCMATQPGEWYAVSRSPDRYNSAVCCRKVLTTCVEDNALGTRFNAIVRTCLRNVPQLNQCILNDYKVLCLW